MLQALLADLAAISGCTVCATRDARLPPLPEGIMQTPVTAGCADVWMLWEAGMRQADAVWPIAPESGGVLERLCRLAVAHGKRLLGSTPQAVALAASKRATAAVLAAHGVAVLPTFLPEALPQGSDGPWVAKPDDGAGCGDTRWFADPAALHAWLQQGGRHASHVVQPYWPGVPASLSMLCRDGQAWLLSCNRQDVRLHDGAFTFHGCVVGGMAARAGEFGVLATAVAAAMPGLAGHVGVDVIVGDHGVRVLEVNPRLTTSYAGLHRALGVNPARLALDLLYNEHFPCLPATTCQVVPIALDE